MSKLTQSEREVVRKTLETYPAGVKRSLHCAIWVAGAGPASEH